jgi:hypothetical protein
MESVQSYLSNPLIVDPDVTTDMSLEWMLLIVTHTSVVKSIYSRKLKDDTIVRLLVSAGVSAQLIVDAVIINRRKHRLGIPMDASYYRALLIRHLPSNSVSDLAFFWGFPIDRWYAIRDAKGAYHLVSGSTHIKCGDVGDVRNYVTFSGKILLHLNKHIPVHSRSEWIDGPARILIEQVEVIYK